VLADRVVLQMTPEASGDDAVGHPLDEHHQLAPYPDA
jgi:hypothetical protein